MLSIPPLESFGPRICVCGPSNAGKSTLTQALAGKIGATPVHLDQYRFLPNTDWQERPDEEFARLHDQAVAGETWVIDGGYSKLLPTRLDACHRPHSTSGQSLVQSHALLLSHAVSASPRRQS